MAVDHAAGVERPVDEETYRVRGQVMGHVWFASVGWRMCVGVGVGVCVLALVLVMVMAVSYTHLTLPTIYSV